MQRRSHGASYAVGGTQDWSTKDLGAKNRATLNLTGDGCPGAAIVPFGENPKRHRRTNPRRHAHGSPILNSMLIARNQWPRATDNSLQSFGGAVKTGGMLCFRGCTRRGVYNFGRIGL